MDCVREPSKLACSRFDSWWGCFGIVAQLVERLIAIQKVEGSTPFYPSLATASRGRGSNPTVEEGRDISPGANPGWGLEGPVDINPVQWEP